MNGRSIPPGPEHSGPQAWWEWQGASLDLQYSAHDRLVAGDGADVRVDARIEGDLTEGGPPWCAGSDLLAGLLDHEVVVRPSLADDGDAERPGGHGQAVRCPLEGVRPEQSDVRVGESGAVVATAGGEDEPGDGSDQGRTHRT